MANTTSFKKGSTPWNKGKTTGFSPRKGVKLSDEIKQKMSKGKKGKPSSKKGKKYPEIVAWNRGLLGFLGGENHYNWKGGRSRGYKTGYYSNKYKIWRKNVFERDGYKCVKCGFKGSSGFITAHHIKSFTFFPHLRFEIDNGQTLCEICHSETDNYKGRARKGMNV